MLRNNPVGSALVSVFFLLALTACWLSVRYYFSVKEAQAMQFQFQTIQATMNGMKVLVADCIEYSKRDPELDRLLQEFKLKAPAAAPSPAPPARPAR